MFERFSCHNKTQRERERGGGEGELLRAVRSTRVRNNERERMTARDTMTRKRE